MKSSTTRCASSIHPPRVIGPDEKLPLALSSREQKLLNDSLATIDLPAEQVRQLEHGKKPVLRLTLPDWDLFAGGVAAECNHCRSARRQKEWRAFLDRVQQILDSHRTAEP
jgi:hypothetical protein